MIANKNRVLFIDIETVPQFYITDVTKDSIPEPYRSAWKDRIKSFDLTNEKNQLKKIEEEVSKTNFSYLPKEAEKDEIIVNLSYKNRAALHPEFSQIVCICAGQLSGTNTLVKYDYYNYDKPDNTEKEMLIRFIQLLKDYGKEFDYICAHNGKQFDFPFLIKRMLIHRIALPNIFKVLNKKPWEITQFIDTYEVWKFGGMQSASLRAMYAVLFGKDCKDDITGSDVSELWFDEPDKNRDRIVNYCTSDVGYMCNIFWTLNDLV
jgi:DNA polymerase elongation subunit (family B)